MSIFTPTKAGKRELALASELMRENKFVEALEEAKKGLKILRNKGTAQEISFANGKILEIQALQHLEQHNYKNASGAYSQAGRYYKQSDSKNDELRVLKKHAAILQDIGRENAEQKAFDSAAAAFEEAAISLKRINQDVEALEVRAKAFVFRAASVKNAPDRRVFLHQASELFRKSGIDEPIVHGHLEYYSAMAQRYSNKQQAIQTLDNAINFYLQAGNQTMVETARSMQSTIRQSMNQE
ncbi:MAG: hypothetical protein ACW98K_15440 [Candidatus Kariarchaeaceae archaeon]